MSKALLLGIALSSNMGGAASPIASPQNLIALQNMQPQPGWGIWFFIALPVCIVTILFIWILLLITFRPGRNTTIVPIRPMKDKFSGVQWFITIVTIATIALWCVSHQLEGIFGDMGVIAIIPIVLFFGSGILTKEDFNNFLWTIIILAAGGLALGKAVNSSGLLHTIALSLTERVETSEFVWRHVRLRRVDWSCGYVHQSHCCCSDYFAASATSRLVHERSTPKFAGHGQCVDGERRNGFADLWLPEYE